MPTRDAIRWFKSHFETKIDAAVFGTPFTSDLMRRTYNVDHQIEKVTIKFID